MASLYNTANRIRRIFFIAMTAVIFILVVDTAVKYIQSPNSPFQPAPNFYLETNSVLGEIAAPSIPSLSIANEDTQPSFLVNGRFPEYPTTCLVYSIDRPRETLSTVANATKTATALGFIEQYEDISSRELLWKNNQETPTRTLLFNKVEQTWRMTTQFFVDINKSNTENVNDDVSFYANNSLKTNILRALNFTDRSITEGVAEPKLAKLNVNGFFSSPFNPAEADYVYYPIYRQLNFALLKPASQLPSGLEPPEEFVGKVYKTDPRVGSLQMTIAGTLRSTADYSKDIFDISFADYTYNFSYGVRKIISPDQAWSRVQNGDGSLVLIQLDSTDYFAGNDSVDVKRFTLNAAATEMGYWEPDEWDGFVYPIYIFRGQIETQDGQTGKFIFYVDALSRVL